MKKYSTLLLIYMLNTGAQAQVYIGVGALGNVLSGKQSLTAAEHNIGENSHFKNSGLSNTSPSLEFFAGWGGSFQSFYIGIEGNYSFLKTESQFKSQISGDKEEDLITKLGSGYGAAIRLGCWASANTLMYARMGVETRKITINFHDNDEILVGMHKSYRAYGFVPGVGVEVKLNPHVALRLEVRAAFYPTKRFDEVRSQTDYTKITTQPRLYSVMGGVTYTF